MNARGRARARFAARAFPAAWRAEHLDEFLDTVDELSPGEHLPWRMALDIVLAGWGERLRNHPPFVRWLAYAFLDLRLPERWHAWVRADVEGRWYWLRRGLRYVLLFDLTWTLTGAALRFAYAGAPMPWSVLVGTLVVLPVSRLTVASARRRVLRRHALDGDASASYVPYLAAPTASVPVAEVACLVALAAASVAAAAFGRVLLHPRRAPALADVVVVPEALPVGRGAVALLALVGLVLGGVLGRAAACTVRRRAVRLGRPDATPAERRRRRLGEAALVALAAIGTLQGAVGMWRDQVALLLGAVVLAVGIVAASTAWAARRRSTAGAPFTWADLIASSSTVLATFDGRGRPAAG